MKKILLLFALVLSFSLTFAACSEGVSGNYASAANDQAAENDAAAENGPTEDDLDSSGSDISDLDLSSLPGGEENASLEAENSTKGSVKTPSMRDIDISNPGDRSAADIMRVIRQRTPGLRHIYEKCLKKKPGFAGKVTLRFVIAPGGEIIGIETVSSTTGFREFDSEIKNAVSRWTFPKAKSGNTVVTVPFTFTQ